MSRERFPLDGRSVPAEVVYPAEVSMDENRRLKILLIAIALLVLANIFLLCRKGGGHDHQVVDRPIKGFVFEAKKDINIPGSRGMTSATYASPADATFQKRGNGFFGVKVIPRNEVSHLYAVRESSFTWGRSSYYDAVNAKFPPMNKSHFDDFVDTKLRPKFDKFVINHEMMGLMKQAENSQEIRDARTLMNQGRYAEALEIFQRVLKTTSNVCLKAAALSNITEIFRRTGDTVQEKKAQGALIVASAQVYLSSFPDQTNALKAVSPIAGDVMKRFSDDRLNVEFKAPKAVGR